MTENKDTSSATWKFDFSDTVQADPLAKGYCLAVIRAYLHFCSKADPRAFCSITELMLRTGASRPAVIRAKALLEKLGYLVPLYVTDEGATMYRLLNVRKQIIEDHLRIARESLAAAKRDRKRLERRMARGDKETILPKNSDFERNVTPVLNETLPNTVDEYRRNIISEGSDESLYTSADEILPDDYFTPPDDITELRLWITERCSDREKLKLAFQLGATKQLTPEIMRELAA
jgi:hypothetical protein